jgi:S1-C subfamily serine protease
MSSPDDADRTEPQIPPPPPPPPSYALPPSYEVPAPPPPPAPPAHAAAPALPERTVARHARQSRRRSLTALAVAGLLTCATILGYSMGADHASNSTSAASLGALPASQSQLPSLPGGSSSGGPSSGSSGRQSSIDLNAIASKVSPAIVNINSSLSNGEAAGTGIVVSSSGLVLTNNHVIEDSTSLNVEIGGDGSSHPAKVLGYDKADDVALVQIEGVSGLDAATLGNSSSLQVGDAIVALGNAGGKGGSPSVVSGTVTALDQQITASDQDGSNAETLDGLIQINANIQPGDSGGPLVDANGDVVGMDAAASSGNGGFGFGGQSASNEGYAIPIEHALSIAKQIQAGNGTDSIHIGGHRALLGVAVSADTANGYGDPFGGNGDFGGNSGRGSSVPGNGATVSDVQSGSGADSAGIQSGDVIVGIDGTSVGSASDLTHAMVKYSPGDQVSVEWVDSSGQSHTATVELGSGTPA